MRCESSVLPLGVLHSLWAMVAISDGTHPEKQAECRV